MCPLIIKQVLGKEVFEFMHYLFVLTGRCRPILDVSSASILDNENVRNSIRNITAAQCQSGYYA